jgi:membrane associated rhomboid family serine protease
MIPLRDTQPSYSKPIVTMLIIAVNVLAFLFEVSLDPDLREALIFAYGIVPDRFQYTDVLTSMFLHGGWMHLIGNMWFLWIYGDNIEDILGHGKFLLFYLACGCFAGIVHVWTNPYSRIPTIGASGAIAGVMGAYLIKFPHSRIVTLVPIFFFLTTMEISAVVILVYWFIIQIFSGFGSIASASQRGGVAWFAHVGGFIAGMILVHVLGTKERFRNRRDLRW